MSVGGITRPGSQKAQSTSESTSASARAEAPGNPGKPAPSDEKSERKAASAITQQAKRTLAAAGSASARSKLDDDGSPPPDLGRVRAGKAVMSRGAQGDAVRELQEKLNQHDASPPLTTDGDFGARTESALRDFQERSGLIASGSLDRSTLHALEAPTQRAVTSTGRHLPHVTVGHTAVPGSRGWEGVGTHSNPVAYEHKEGVRDTDAHSIAVGEKQIEDLHPQLTRVRVHPKILELQDPNFKKNDPQGYAEATKRYAELKHLTEQSLKHHGHADICLWNLQKGYRTSPAEMKQVTDRFAHVVKDLMEHTKGADRGDFLVSAQNEPNRTKLSPDQIVMLNKDLDASLRKTLGEDGRGNVKLVMGDMTGSDHTERWIKSVVPRLAGTVDAFSFHVYAHHGESSEALEGRLRSLRQQVNAATPRGTRPPELLLTEYGVRGAKKPGAPSDSPGDLVLHDGKHVPLRDTPEGAFREAQMVLAAARTGFSGAVRWGANPGGGTPWTSWSMTGTRAEGYEKKPAYNVSQLFTTAIGPGWRPEQAEGHVAGQSVATFRAPNGKDCAAVVANSNTSHQQMELGGFPPNKPAQVLIWNARGGGRLVSRAVTPDAGGNVRIDLSPHSVIAVTTRTERPEI